MFHHGNLRDYLLKLLSHLSDKSLTPALSSYDIKTRVKFYWNNIWLFKTTKNIYIVYELGASSSINNDPTLKKCLFGAVALTKNADIDKYGYSGYGIGFDRRSSFSFSGGGFGQKVLIFGADMSSHAHIDNRKKTYQFSEQDQHKDQNIL